MAGKGSASVRIPAPAWISGDAMSNWKNVGPPSKISLRGARRLTTTTCHFVDLV